MLFFEKSSNATYTEQSQRSVLEGQMDTVLNDTSTHAHPVYNQVQAYNGWRRNLVKGGPRQNQSAGIFHGRDLARQNDVNVAATQRPPTPGLETASNSGYSLSGPTYTHAAPVTPVYQEFAICKAESTSTTQLPNHLDAEKEDEGYRTGENSHNFDHPPQPNSGVAPPSTGVMSIAENSSFHHTPTSGPILTQDIPAQFTHTASAPLYDLSNEASKTAYAAQSGIPPQIHSLPLYIAPGTISPVNTLPPSPSARSQTPFTAPESQESSQTPSQALKKCCVDKHGWPFEGLSDDSPWAPEVQKKYDQFLHDERINVTEGLWDLFPMQSRLFVGNLPTERITKRDMFHIFHKYGKLAQIAIKQAYGFIQFLEASSCNAALRFEQGVIVRGRKIRLEDLLGLLQCLPGHPRRVVRGHRSWAELPRSLPLGSLEIYTTSPTSQVNCLPMVSVMGSFIADAVIVVHRDHGPLGFAGLDTSTDRATEVLQGETYLPIPRRAPRDVPDVQLVVLEELDRDFVFYVEDVFRNRGLRVDVLVLGPGISLGAAVHRQFIEGVLAVVRLSRPNQISRKIPLQLFDRTAGLDNVRFLDYPELDPNMSAELLSHQAQAMQRGAAPIEFAPNPAFVIPAMSPMSIPQPNLPVPSNYRSLANLIYSPDGPRIPSLLLATQRTPYSQPVSATQLPVSCFNAPPAPDLASLMPNANPRQVIPTTTQQSVPPSNLEPPNAPAPVVTHPNLLSLLARGWAG
ncbi:putative RNA-binding protein [Penicillium chrysogenum]|uniref:Putative RNA-binding protein n=1 Tax=Penicillium chrysogenum TaxID=5076 RepID=A0A167V7K2_PENCH|nr:putative RNA-binding protein [Penicillium chrysogenum]